MSQTSPTPSTPGRPTSFSVLTFQAICAHIADFGSSDSAAAAAVGVSTSSLSRWKQNAPELATMLLRARQTFRQRHIEAITQASHRGGWRASAWLLERVFPEDYAPRAQERARFQAMAASEEMPSADLPPLVAPAPVAAPEPSEESAPVANPAPPTVPAPLDSPSEPVTENTPVSASRPVSTSVAPSHNSQNSPSAPLPSDWLAQATTRPDRPEILERPYLPAAA